MPITSDVMELVSILAEEGFGYLAGEIITEISFGREVQRTPERPADADPAAMVGESRDDRLAEESFVKLDDGTVLPRRYFDVDGGVGEAEAERVEIEEADQLRFAVDLLTSRLVEPLRKLAEAERLAGSLWLPDGAGSAPESVLPKHHGDTFSSAKLDSHPMPIRFVDGFEATAEVGRDAPAGTDRPAADLGDVLKRLLERT